MSGTKKARAETAQMMSQGMQRTASLLVRLCLSEVYMALQFPPLDDTCHTLLFAHTANFSAQHTVHVCAVTKMYIHFAHMRIFRV